ncbi:MAG: hypothetical protein JJ863_35410 [Deltaproteobacteria bacterium]|nr:hypothetical protein [Deltaproteobacteria bacterium]
MIDVTIEEETEGATVLSLRATHPDTWAFPFPHHRIAWARVLWDADRSREWLLDQPAEPEHWALARSLDGVDLVDLADYPRIRDEDDAPVLRVRVRHSGPLFDFAITPRRQWRTAARSSDRMPITIERSSRRAGDWTRKQIQALSADEAKNSAEARAELVRAAEAGVWWDWVAPVFETYDDYVADVLDHTHQWAASVHPHYDDPRYEQWLRVAAGDPTTCGVALPRIAKAGDPEDRPLLEQAYRAAHAKRSIFWAAKRHVLVRPITVWSLAEHGDAAAKAKVDAMSKRTRKDLDRHLERVL